MTLLEVRGYAEPPGGWSIKASPTSTTKRRYGAERALVFHVSRVDDRPVVAWRVVGDNGVCWSEGLAGENLVDAEAGDGVFGRRLVISTIDQWLYRYLFRIAYKGRGAVVGWGLPEAFAALAKAWGPAEPNVRRTNSEGEAWLVSSMYRGGFTLHLWWRRCKDGRWRDGYDRPALNVRSIGDGRCFVGFGSTMADHERKRPPWRGRFVELRQLCAAVTGKAGSLEEVCADLGVKIGEAPVGPLGAARARVAALAGLYQACRNELAQHPGIDLDEAKLWSPATVGTRYLDAMRVVPPLLRHAGIDRAVLGAATAALHGGRIDARIVGAQVPVVYLDFASMYPTVAVLTGAWSAMTAEALVTEDVTDELRGFLGRPDLADAFLDPAAWSAWGLTFCEVDADGDVLPHVVAGEPKLRVQPLTASSVHCSWADAAASAVAAGRAPKIIRAWRLHSTGPQTSLRPVQLRGEKHFDPVGDDLFARLMELRGQATDHRAAQFYKVVNNSITHGLPSQLNDSAPGPEPETVQVHDGAGEYTAKVDRLESPGRFYWPPVAATICACGRLLLALIEKMVADAGGTWAWMSTDSIAVVAGETATTMTVGETAVPVLARGQVMDLADRFRPLSVTGEVPWRAQHDSDTEPTWAVCLGPVRYMLYRTPRSTEALAPGEEPVLVDGTESGLGGLFVDPIGDDSRPDVAGVRPWVADAWCWTLGVIAGSKPKNPDWWDTPAVRPFVLSTARMVKHSAVGVAAEPYAEGLWGQVDASGPALVRQMRGVRVAPAAPWDPNPGMWPTLRWVDRNQKAGKAWKRTPIAWDDTEDCSGSGLRLKSIGFHVRTRIPGRPGRVRPTVVVPGATVATGYIVVGKIAAGTDELAFGAVDELGGRRELVYGRRCRWCNGLLDADVRVDATAHDRCADAARARDYRARRAAERPVAACALAGCTRPSRPRSDCCCDSHSRKVWRAAKRKVSYL